MAAKLVVLLLGHQSAGKSTTWYELFGEQVRTGQSMRRLDLTRCHYIEDVFLVNGSPEEREESISDIIGDNRPTVVLCSTQYVASNKTISYFIKEEYDLYVHWLNPGYRDVRAYPDDLNLANKLLSAGATVAKRDGRLPSHGRVNEIREFVFGWASARNLINTDF